MAEKERSKEGSGRGEATPKRKKREDAPRGMAWGAQSFAAARIGGIREKNPDSISDFGRYMAEKRRKLHLQYDADSSNKLLSGATAAVAGQHAKEGQITVVEDSHKHLFKGVSIWVDGFTIPSHQELHHLMLQYGGVFENYFRRDLVTHIICSTLPDSKIKNPRSFSRGLPIVKPEWVVNSIAAGRVLPWGSYQLQRIAYEHPNQRSLHSSFTASKPEDGPLPLDWRDGDSISCDAFGCETKAPQELFAIEEGEASPGFDDFMQERAEGFTRQDETVDGEAGKEFPMRGELDNCDAEYVERRVESPGKEELEKHGEDNLGIAGRSKREPSGYSTRTHSTLGDKNFVQNYFKYSRLHFIGTWRNRYQSRYASSVKNDKFDGQEHQGIKGLSNVPPYIIHVDMDCFFVAVVVRERRELDGKPVAVCHSDSARGTGEISSANYPARAFGVRAGMFVRDAKARCPDLEIVPYNFEAYEKVADQVYDILHHHCGRVQAVSCDEAFLNVSGQGDPNEIARTIRGQIYEATGCTASCGVAGNMLLARLATKKAKPNGRYHIPPDQVEAFMAVLAVEDLPGVGWMLRDKLHSQNLRKCTDLLNVSKDSLQREYGLKTGNMLWTYSRGIDAREVQPAQERKSIGAEVNWGVRFLVPDDVHRFLVTLSKEVSVRLHTAAARGRTITLKVKRRKEGTGEPHKFMGCGACDNFSRSETVAYATDSEEILLRVAQLLFNSFHFDVCEVRGVGLQVTRLESVGPGQQCGGGQVQQGALQAWLASKTKQVSDQEVFSVPETENLNTTMDCKPLRAEVKPATSIEEQKPPPSVVSNDQRPSQLGGQVQHRALEAWLAPHSKAVPYQQVFKVPQPGNHNKTLPFRAEVDQTSAISDSINEDKTPPLSVSKDWNVSHPEPPQVPSLASEIITASRGSASPRAGKSAARNLKKVKKPVSTLSAGLPPISEIDPSVLASLPPDIIAEIREAYGELPAHFVKGTKAKEGSLSSPTCGAIVGQNVNSRSKDLNLEVAVERRGLETATHEREVKQSPSKRGESSRMASETDTEIMALPPASQLDPDVMAALPLSLRRELEHEYKQQQSDSRPRPLVSKSVMKEEPQVAPHVVEASTSASESSLIEQNVLQNANDLTQLQDLWLGSPPKWVRLFEKLKAGGANALCFFAENSASEIVSKSFSTILLSLLPRLCEDTLGAEMGDEIVVQSSVELVKQYARLTVARDLEEVQTVMRLVKRVAAKSQLWRVVEALTVPSVQCASLRGRLIRHKLRLLNTIRDSSRSRNELTLALSLHPVSRNALTSSQRKWMQPHYSESSYAKRICSVSTTWKNRRPNFKLRHPTRKYGRPYEQQ